MSDKKMNLKVFVKDWPQQVEQEIIKSKDAEFEHPRCLVGGGADKP